MEHQVWSKLHPRDVWENIYGGPNGGEGGVEVSTEYAGAFSSNSKGP